MAPPSIADLTAAAAEADEPGFTPASTVKPGGVDPLGLRQINFGLMDQVLPGLNNVARHVRPFVVVAWAWRRAKRIAEAQRQVRIPVDDLRDFVDRIEVIYAWSQFRRDPNADLPGRQVLGDLLAPDSYTFGGAAWRKRREVRRFSTAFTAPINYGPALKTLGWVEPHREHSNILIATAAADPALDAFENLIADRLDHPAFSQFGSVVVTAQEVEDWAEAWALERVTEAERRIMTEMLFGSKAPATRRSGGSLMLAASTYSSTAQADRVRSVMAGAPTNFLAPVKLEMASHAWRRMQVRQLFRLSLEAFLYWVISRLERGPKYTNTLVDAFLGQVPGRPAGSEAREWLRTGNLTGVGSTELMNRIAQAFDGQSNVDLAPGIADGIAFCLLEAPQQGQNFERIDRLPLFRARREAEAWGHAPARAFVHNILESWVLAQHVYWSVGRGLADARARGKTLLRLKVVLDEGGWTLAPGASRGSPPAPTPDRLATALSLARECGLLDEVAP